MGRGDATHLPMSVREEFITRYAWGSVGTRARTPAPARARGGDGVDVLRCCGERKADGNASAQRATGGFAAAVGPAGAGCADRRRGGRGGAAVCLGAQRRG